MLAVADSFRRVNPAASLKHPTTGDDGAYGTLRFRRVNPAASLKLLGWTATPSKSSRVSAG